MHEILHGQSQIYDKVQNTAADAARKKGGGAKASTEPRFYIGLFIYKICK